jgi:GNAT superfamily N-acetyltransferase
MEHMRREVEENDLWIAEVGREPVGAMLLGEAPTRYVEPIAERELFLHLLVTSRRFIGRGIGRALVEQAQGGCPGAGDRPDPGRLLR